MPFFWPKTPTPNSSPACDSTIAGLITGFGSQNGLCEAHMAVLGLFDPKSALAVTMPIVTAFKFCIGHRKNGLLNR
jgi:hypothetical protein